MNIDVYFLASTVLLLAIFAAVFFRPWLGLLLLLVAGSLGRWARLPGLEMDLKEAIGILTLWSAALYLMMNRRRVRTSPADLPILLLSAAMLLSLRHAADRDALMGGLSLVAILGLYFVGEQLLDTEGKIRAALLTVLGVAAVVSAACMVLYLLGVSSLSVGGTASRIVTGGGTGARIGGPYEQPNVWAQFTAIAVPLGLGLTLSSKGLVRVLIGALTAVNLVCTVMTQSRSALVGIAAGVLCVVYLTQSRRRFAMASVLGAVLLIYAYQSWKESRQQSFGHMSSQGVAEEVAQRGTSRRRIFLAAVKVFWEQPWGTGFGTDAGAVGAELGLRSLSPHNTLLRWGIETGVLGFLAGLWLLVLQFRSTWRVARFPVGTRFSFLAAGCAGAIAATWIHNMFHTTLNLVFVWIFFSAASALVVLATPRPTVGQRARMLA